MQKHQWKLAAFSVTGHHSHIAGIVDINKQVEVMTLCGLLLPANLLVDLPHNQITCERCRKSSAKYNHKIGKVN
jgi:hypothetical protein